MLYKKIAVFGLAISLASAGLSPQAVNKFSFPLSQYKLKNGLQVILSEDYSMPVVSVAVAYRVGSISDPPGKSGLAFLMRNLMFSGSVDVPQPQLNYINRVGGRLNAAASEDVTAFYQTVPSNQLALVLWLESDRMRYLELNEANFEQERNKLLEMVRQRKTSEPYSESELAFDQLVYVDFPYSHPLLGSEEDVRDLTLDDAKNFYSAYYVPNNAVLCVTGNFNKLKARELVARYFETIPRGKDISLPIEPFVFTKKQVVKTVEDSQALAPALYVGFRLVFFAPQDYYTLTILDYILMRGRSSRLPRRLLNPDNKIAYQLNGGIDYRRDRAACKIFVVANDPDLAGQCQNAIFSELNKLKSAFPPETELDKAKNMFKRDYLNRTATSLDKAIYLCEAYFALRNFADLPLELDKYLKVTTEDIVTVAHRYFNTDNSLILNVRTK